MARTTSPIRNKKIPVSKSALPGILGFGAGNLFPQELLRVISDSVTATACLSAKAEFIEGNGFSDTELSRLVVHKSGLTLDSVLSKTAYNEAFLEGSAIHVTYNGLGRVAGFRAIPAEYVRYCEPEKGTDEITHAAVCPYLDSTVYAARQKEHTRMALFNPDPAVVLEQIAMAGGINSYTGQLIFEPSWMPGDDIYHRPSFFSGIRAIESEGQLDLYDWRTITSGFNISGILKVLSPIAGPDGQAYGTMTRYDSAGQPYEVTTRYEPLLDENSIESQLSDHQGADNAASILIQRFDTKEELEMTQFIDTTGSNLADRYNSTFDRKQSEIARAFRVPNELIGVRRSGGIAPTGDEIRVSSQLMQQTVNRTQRKIQALFFALLKNWHQPITFKDGPKTGLPCEIENLNYFPEANVNPAASPAVA